MPQNLITAKPIKGVPGSRVDTGLDYFMQTAFVEGPAIPPGVFAIRGTADDQARVPTVANTADVDAFKTNIASAATPQTIVAAGLDGVIGSGSLPVPSQVTLVLSASADWDATTAVLTGEDELGNVLQENLAIPNGGNATVTSVKRYTKVTSLYIPAQSGAGGTATLGNAASFTVDITEVLGVVNYEDIREWKKLPTATQGFYLEGARIGIWRKGRIRVTSETAARAGDPVFMRFVVTGNEQGGAIRNVADASDCIDISSFCRYAESCGAGETVSIDLNIP